MVEDKTRGITAVDRIMPGRWTLLSGKVFGRVINTQRPGIRWLCSLSKLP